MKVFLVAVLTAVILAPVLAWRTPLITKGIYRLGFLVGLASFGAILLYPPSSLTLNLGRGAFAVLAVVPLVLAAMVPYVLLVEAGIAGYRGFSSWIRYLSLALAALGGIGLVTSLLLPRLLRR